MGVSLVDFELTLDMRFPVFEIVVLLCRASAEFRHLEPRPKISEDDRLPDQARGRRCTPAPQDEPRTIRRGAHFRTMQCSEISPTSCDCLSWRVHHPQCED